MARKTLNLLDGHSRLMASSTTSQYQPYWQPAVDIYRCPAEWMVKVDLAGVNPDDIIISLQQNHLHISGQRRDMQVHQGHQTYSMEISYNRFARNIELPFDTSDSDVRSDYSDGMLYIHITPAGSQ